MRGNNDRVYVAKEKESSNERVYPLRRHVRKLLLDQRPNGLAQPPDAVRDVPNRVPQSLQDLENELLENGDAGLDVLVNCRMILSLQEGIKGLHRREISLILYTHGLVFS